MWVFNVFRYLVFYFASLNNDPALWNMYLQFNSQGATCWAYVEHLSYIRADDPLVVPPCPYDEDLPYLLGKDGQ